MGHFQPILQTGTKEIFLLYKIQTAYLKKIIEVKKKNHIAYPFILHQASCKHRTFTLASAASDMIFLIFSKIAFRCSTNGADVGSTILC